MTYTVFFKKRVKHRRIKGAEEVVEGRIPCGADEWLADRRALAMVETGGAYFSTVEVMA